MNGFNAINDARDYFGSPDAERAASHHGREDVSPAGHVGASGGGANAKRSEAGESRRLSDERVQSAARAGAALDESGNAARSADASGGKLAAKADGNGLTSSRERDQTYGELVFKGSPTPTIGVEIELAVLDKEDFHLAPGAPRILAACKEENIEGVTAELMQSMLEVRTGVCQDVSEARRQLRSTIRRVRNVAGSLGYDLALFGTHPFQRINASALTEDPRYARIANKLGWITYHRVAFGLHTHVGVASGDEAIGLMNQLVHYLPHLLALSANSPFWQGVDTGLASSRSVLYGLVAHSGVPHQFEGWKDFREYYQVMRDCRAIQTLKGIKWDIRPRPDLGTLEFRVCDMPGSMDVAMALAALSRTLVIATRQLLSEKPEAQRSDRRREWINAESKWLAARYGLEAVYIRSPKGKRRALGQEISELIERLMPIARQSGDHSHLMKILPVEKFETGADRQRRLYREHGEWQSLIRDSIDRLGEELKEKKAAPRDPKAEGRVQPSGGLRAGRAVGDRDRRSEE